MAKEKRRPLRHPPISSSKAERFLGARLAELDARAAAIIGSGIVEHELARAIMTKMRVLTPVEHNRIFEGYGVLSSFSQKIDMGYALGIYGAVERKELESIKTIRNEFAHNIRIKTLNHPKIRKACRALRGSEYYEFFAKVVGQKALGRPRSLRGRFHRSITVMYVFLANSRNSSWVSVRTKFSLSSVYFRTWLETGALPVIQVIRTRGDK